MLRYALRNPLEGELFTPVETKRLDIVLAGKQQRHQADADQVRPMDALERARDHRPHAEQGRPFGGPVAAASGPEIVSSEHDQPNVALAIAHRRLGDGDRFAFRVDTRPPAFAVP